jgi:hypothetical protein
MNWLSKSIALPLFLTIVNLATTAGAQPIDRSPNISMRSTSSAVESFPSVTDLNLLVPVPADVSAPQEREQVNSIAPFWSQPPQPNSATTTLRIQPNHSKLRTRRTTGLSINTSTTRTATGETVTKTKPKFTSRYQNSGSTHPDSLRAAIVKNSQRSRASSRRLIAASNLQVSGNYLRLVRDSSQRTNEIGNPIYTLEAYVDGQKYQTFTAVSGTVNTQTIDRNIGNNSAPLPDGLYEVSHQIMPGNTPEVGKTFIGIFPKFVTRRSGLGIHLDRSFNQHNGYDGTAGCIGMTTATDRDAINEFVTKYHPRNLFVKIASVDDRE